MATTGEWKRNAGRAARSSNLRNSARASHQMPREGRSARTPKMANTHLGARDVGVHARASRQVTAGAPGRGMWDGVEPTNVENRAKGNVQMEAAKKRRVRLRMLLSRPLLSVSLV
jgi:hypothetical protein